MENRKLDTFAAVQVREARTILSEATAETPRVLVCWAAGVLVVQHAQQLSPIPVIPERLAPADAGGGMLDRGRKYTFGRRIFTVEGATAASGWRHGIVVRVTWADVALVLRPEKVGSGLRLEIRRAVDRRRELTVGGPGWDEHEARCRDLAAQAWDRCRPAPAPAQGSLFDGPAAS